MVRKIAVNQSRIERVVRLFAGLLFGYVGVAGHTVLADFFDVLGLALVFTGLTGYCLIYDILGVRTNHSHA